MHIYYIDALLNGESLDDAFERLSLSCDKWKRQINEQYALAQAFKKELTLPDEDPRKIATLEYLRRIRELNVSAFQ